MRLPLALVLGVLLGTAQAAKLDPRQQDNSDNNGNGNGNGNGSGGSDSNSVSATPGPGPGSTSEPPKQTSSSAPPPNEGDVTTTITTTVKGDADVKTDTSTTTIGSTIVRTQTSTITEYSTTTITKSDSDVQTETVWETVTATSAGDSNQKRHAGNGLAPRTGAPQPTAHLNDLHRRDTITKVETVTEGGGSSTTTVLKTISQDVVSQKIERTTTTSLQTETKQANAKSTTTVTSTRTENAIASMPPETSASESEGSGSGSGSSSSSGLSTGAKAGIGAGVGVGGLLVIGALLFCCMRRRRSSKADPDMMAGASEVPVGGRGAGAGAAAVGSARPMSHNSASNGGYLAPGRVPVSKKASPEGYRGTAMGDGRAGYAKPTSSAYTGSRSTTGTAPHNAGPDALPEHSHPAGENVMYAVPGSGVSPVSRGSTAPGGAPAPMPTPSPQPQQHMQQPPPQNFAAELGTDNTAANKWHSDNAAEIDSQPAMSHQSGPVYEMPTEPYR